MFIGITEKENYTVFINTDCIVAVDYDMAENIMFVYLTNGMRKQTNIPEEIGMLSQVMQAIYISSDTEKQL